MKWHVIIIATFLMNIARAEDFSFNAQPYVLLNGYKISHIPTIL